MVGFVDMGGSMSLEDGGWRIDASGRLTPGGAGLPAVGLGLWKIDTSEVAGVVQTAIDLGYRHFDAACDYGNEAQVGEGLRAAIEGGRCTRESLWITSKLWNTYHRPEHVRGALERSLRDLGLDYLDLYLIHFPIALTYVPPEVRYPPGWLYDPAAERPCMVPDPSPVPLAHTWQALEELVDAGLVRNIGVSNFSVALIRDLLTQCRIRPHALQVELHPYLAQQKLLRFCREQGILVTGFSPLGAPSYVPLGMATPQESVLARPEVLEIARQLGRSPAQIVLRWGVQRGTAVIPKSSCPERLAENIALFDFALTDQQMETISGMDQGRRYNDPGVFCEHAFGTFYPIYE